MELQQSIIITQEPYSVLDRLKELKRDEKFTIIDSQDREFLIEHASEAISKAYIADEVREFIILISPRFSTISQNRLLKILEEPPKNKDFILITKSKSSILPTIKSRLPIIKESNSKKIEKLSLDIESLDLKEIYEFSQKYKRISSKDCKEIIEKIGIDVIKSKSYNIDSSLLKTLSNSIKALEVGSAGQFVLNGVLLKLLHSKISNKK